MMVLCLLRMGNKLRIGQLPDCSENPIRNLLGTFTIVKVDIHMGTLRL